MSADTVDALTVEEMKQKIEEQFDNTEVKELRGIFDDVDASGSGSIDLVEFAKGLKTLGLGLDSVAVESEFREILQHKQKVNRAYDPAARLETKIEFSDFEEFWQSNVRFTRTDIFTVVYYSHRPAKCNTGKQDASGES